MEILSRVGSATIFKIGKTMLCPARQKSKSQVFILSFFRIGVLSHWSRALELTTTGIWTDGRLEGLGWTDNEYGGFEESVYRSGVKHGPSRTFGPCPKR